MSLTKPDSSGGRTKPHGEPTKFFLPTNEQYKHKGEIIPININGYEYQAVVGQKNELPEDVVQVLEGLQSQTAVPNMEKYDPERAGVPRDSSQLYQGEKKWAYQRDFDIERL